MSWREFPVEGSTRAIKPYASRFWQKRFYSDGEDKIFANLWEYAYIYTLEIDIPDRLSPTERWMRIETFPYSELNLLQVEIDVRTTLIALFPWIRKDLEE